MTSASISTALKLIISFLIFSPFAQAKLFQNDYVSFELPNRWNCQLEGTEWLCRNQNPKKQKQAIIILTAKEVGASDSLTQYEAFLKAPKSVPAAGGKPSQSQVKSVKQRKINSHQWVDGLHLGSEIPTYYTRYLATTKKAIAVLVTFSAHKKHYTHYSTDFLKAINSLQVIASNQLLTNPGGMPGIRGKNESLGGSIAGAFPSDFGAADMDELPSEPTGTASNTKLMILLGLAVAIVGGYYIYSKKS